MGRQAFKQFPSALLQHQTSFLDFVSPTRIVPAAMATRSPQNTFEGRCACGLVTWTSAQNATHLDACYCRQCQQVSGAPVVYWMGVPTATLTFHGTVETLRLSELATRGFCKECGGTLFMQYSCYPHKTHLAAATTTRNDLGMPLLGTHIFVRSKPEWYKIAEDGVPRWDDWDHEFAATFPDVVAQWKRSENGAS